MDKIDDWSYDNDIYQDIEYIPRLGTRIEGEGIKINIVIEHRIRLLQVIVFHGVDIIAILNYSPEEYNIEKTINFFRHECRKNQILYMFKLLTTSDLIGIRYND